jgi:hypothetical protein
MKSDSEYHDVGNLSLINVGEQITGGHGRRSSLWQVRLGQFLPVLACCRGQGLSYIGQQAYLSLSNFPNI